MYGICNLSIIACRKEPSDKSEITTQLLFGEHFKVLATKGNWCHILTAFDAYKCWIDAKQFQTIPEHIFQKLSEGLKNKTISFSSDLVQLLEHEQSFFPIVIGSNLPFLKADECWLDNEKYIYQGHIAITPHTAIRNLLIEHAYMYLHTPYLWGGRSPFGIDCSGFTQMVYKLCGITLQRDSSLQAEQGTAIAFIEEAEAGDLAFFENEDNKIIHVGIVLNQQKIIHASGEVRIDLIDHQGIFNISTQQYSHKLRLIKRILSE